MIWRDHVAYKVVEIERSHEQYLANDSGCAQQLNKINTSHGKNKKGKAKVVCIASKWITEEEKNKLTKCMQGTISC